MQVVYKFSTRLSCWLLPTQSQFGHTAEGRVKGQDSPTVMDSGRPGAGGTLGTVVGCVSGLESILKHKRIIILQLSWRFNVFLNQIPTLQAALMAYLNVSDTPLSQFAPVCAESHCAGNAAESSTELTEAKCK